MMRTLLVAIAALLTALPVVAQETPADSVPAASPREEERPVRRQRPRTPRNEISQAEVNENLNAGDVYSLVRRLRPHWLNNRGTRQTADADGSYEVMVRYNGRPLGEVTALQRLNTSQIISMTYLPPTESRARFGMGYGRGAIVIVGH